MANKFIVFVAFAAVALASLASATESSTLETAREQSNLALRAASDAVCKVVTNSSRTIADAREEFERYIADAVSALSTVAPSDDDAELQEEVLADAKTIQEALLQSLEDARKVPTCGVIYNDIEATRRSLSYNDLAETLQKLTTKTEPTLRTEYLLKYWYQTLFNQAQRLSHVTCGSEEAGCSSELSYTVANAFINSLLA